MNKLKRIYEGLLAEYGKQGWWPVNGKYHPNDHSYPKNDTQRFEICAGAILAQNTAWKNAEKALEEMKKRKMLEAQKIMSSTHKKLAETIRSSGYHNQKAKKLKAFAEFYKKLGGRTPRREELLRIWGVGPETADSILLYAYKEPEFVIDAYTRRMLKEKRIIRGKEPYDHLKRLFETSMPKSAETYSEYHALIVEWGKRNRKNLKASKKKRIQR